MIYAEALVSDQVLIAKGECGGYPSNKDGSGDDLRHSVQALALLRANKNINSEATPVFFAVNTFKLSPLPCLGRPSVFTKYSPLFRSVVVELFNRCSIMYWAGMIVNFGTCERLIQIWRDQIRALAAMVNLRYLELNARGMLVAVTSSTTLGHLIWGLKPQVLASVPSGVRQKKGGRGSGVWLTMFVNDSYMQDVCEVAESFKSTGTQALFSVDSMHAVGEGWRELGINLRADGTLHPSEISSDFTSSRSCYHG